MRFALIALLMMFVIIVVMLSHYFDEQRTFRPLTSKEVNKFIEENKINAVAVANIGNSTVILYSNVLECGFEDGFYILSVRSDGELIWTKAETIVSRSQNASIIWHRTGIPFLAVVFHDSGIRRVKVVCDGYSKILRVNNRSVIIPIIRNLDCKILFFNENN